MKIEQFPQEKKSKFPILSGQCNISCRLSFMTCPELLQVNLVKETIYRKFCTILCKQVNYRTPGNMTFFRKCADFMACTVLQQQHCSRKFKYFPLLFYILLYNYFLTFILTSKVLINQYKYISQCQHVFFSLVLELFSSQLHQGQGSATLCSKGDSMSLTSSLSLLSYEYHWNV